MLGLLQIQYPDAKSLVFSYSLRVLPEELLDGTTFK